MSSIKPKILVIITQSDFGGAQRFLVQMTDGLKDSFDFVVATGADGGDELDKYLPEYKVIKIKNLKRNISPIADIKSLFAIKELILKERPSKIFLMSSKAGFNGALASLLVPSTIRPKVIYRIGGWAFNDPGSIFKKALFYALEFISAPLKDTIIVNSSHDFKQAQKLFIKPRGELKLIYNGLNLKDSDFLSREEARKALNIESDIFTIGCIANFYETKGLDVLISALNIIKDNDFKCIIIGDGMLREKLERHINALNLETKIILAGKKENAYKYIQAFDVYIQPSRKEGFAWAILEAMSAGLPVIATSVGSAPEIIENAVNGILVESGNSSAIADNIKKLIFDKEFGNKLGSNAHDTATSKFSLPAMLQKIHTLLK